MDQQDLSAHSYVMDRQPPPYWASSEGVTERPSSPGGSVQAAATAKPKTSKTTPKTSAVRDGVAEVVEGGSCFFLTRRHYFPFDGSHPLQGGSLVVMSTTAAGSIVVIGIHGVSILKR